MMIRPSCCSNPQASTHHNTTKQLAHRCSRGAPAAVRRRLPIVAFRPARAPAQTLVEQEDGAPTVLLPLDFYACLAVTRTAGGRAVRDALGRALLKRPEAYYSSDTVALRDLLLRGAAECLLDYDRRREYDAKALSANGYVVSVSLDHLPGALVLLQESGCNQLVLDLGAQWLKDNRQDVRRRDVTAAMALAYHSLAVQSLQQEGGCVLEGCRHLESALSLLRQSIRSSEDAVAVADLQRDVLQLLKEYSPDYCLALLALPLDDSQRQHGHVLLRKLLHELPDDLSPLGPDKDDFMAAARPLMTAHEHLDMYAAGSPRQPSVAQQQLVAEATVAVAFQHRQPLLMLRAGGAFRRLEQFAAAQEGGAPDMCVEHACIALLLGNTSQALAELGLMMPCGQQEGSSSSPTQQAAREYVLSQCPDSVDLLPGVYALAQCWMQQGILGSFRQCAAAVAPDQEQEQDQAAAAAVGVDLAPWYDSMRVRLLILVLALLINVKNCLQAIAGAPAALVASLAWLQRNILAGKQMQQATTQTAPAQSSGQTSTARNGLVEGSTAQPPPAAAATRAEQAQQATATTSAQQELHKGGQQQLKRRRMQQGAAASQGAAQAAASTTAALQQQQQQPQHVKHSADVDHAKRRDTDASDAAVSSSATASEHRPAGRHGAAAASKAAGPTADGDGEAPSLVARARAAAAGSGWSQRAQQQHNNTNMGDSMEEEELGPEPSPAMRRQLSRQMLSLEAQMWDPAPEQPAWRVAIAKALPVLMLGAVAVVVVADARQQPTSSLPQGALLIDSRG